MTITRNRFLANTCLAGIGALACTSWAAAQETESPSRPNIVLIFTDDQGYGDLGCFGAKHVKTPNIDRMAKEGMRFTDFHVAAPTCTPSRSSLLTGSHLERVGSLPVLFPEGRVRWGEKKDLSEQYWFGLNPDEITFAEILKKAGYATACIGKWHLGDHPDHMPNSQGFDYYFGLPYSNDMLNPPLPVYRNREIIERDPDQDHLTQRYTEESISFIKKNKDKPFLVYLPHSMPHRPVHARKQFMDRHLTQEEQSKLSEAKEKGSGNKTLRKNVAYRQKLYRAAIEELDWSVGEILQCLKDEGLENNTLVIFTSDNGANVGKHLTGGGSNAPWFGGKATGWEGGIRVPCVMQWKGHMPANAECAQTTGTIDLLPTFAALAGAEMPTGRVIDGIDLSSVMKNPDTQLPRDYYYCGHSKIRKGKWVCRGTSSLYDFENDPQERNNVVKEHPELVQEMNEACLRIMADIKAHSRQPGMIERTH